MTGAHILVLLWLWLLFVTASALGQTLQVLDSLGGRPFRLETPQYLCFKACALQTQLK